MKKTATIAVLRPPGRNTKLQKGRGKTHDMYPFILSSYVLTWWSDQRQVRNRYIAMMQTYIKHADVYRTMVLVNTATIVQVLSNMSVLKPRNSSEVVHVAAL